MEEVGHEGDLGDGQPEAPGEEGVDDPPVAPAAAEGDPCQTESPASLAGGVVELGFRPVLGGKEVSPVDQEESQQADHGPQDQVQTAVYFDFFVLGEPEQVAAHDTDDVAVVPPAPGGEVVIREDVPVYVVLLRVEDVPGNYLQFINRFGVMFYR